MLWSCTRTRTQKAITAEWWEAAERAVWTEAAILYDAVEDVSLLSPRMAGGCGPRVDHPSSPDVTGQCGSTSTLRRNSATSGGRPRMTCPRRLGGARTLPRATLRGQLLQSTFDCAPFLVRATGSHSEWERQDTMFSTRKRLTWQIQQRKKPAGAVACGRRTWTDHGDLDIAKVDGVTARSRGTGDHRHPENFSRAWTMRCQQFKTHMGLTWSPWGCLM